MRRHAWPLHHPLSHTWLTWGAEASAGSGMQMLTCSWGASRGGAEVTGDQRATQTVRNQGLQP